MYIHEKEALCTNSTISNQYSVITIQIGCALWNEKCDQRDIENMLIDKIDTSVIW